MSSAKILYFVRPDTKPPRVNNSAPYLPASAYTNDDDDEIARQHFNELLKGIWPTPQRRPS